MVAPIPSARSDRTGVATFEPVSRQAVSVFPGNGIQRPRDSAAKIANSPATVSVETATRIKNYADWPRFWWPSGKLRTRRTAWWRTQSISNLSQHPISLLTGKRTGNFIESACTVRFLFINSEQIQRLPAKFPTQQNRELFRRNREFWFSNREFSRSKPKSSPDELFGTQSGAKTARRKQNDFNIVPLIPSANQSG